MKIAVIGAGISGLTAAYSLSEHHQVTVFEAGDYPGGHTATKSVEVNGKKFEVDTGFIVYNDWTYPHFIELLDKLGVASQATSMGFSAFKQDGSFYYSGDNPSALFAKRSLLLSYAHWMLLKDIVRFNSHASKDYKNNGLPVGQTLGEYLQVNGYGESFKNHYLVPMGAAIWSASTQDMMDFDVNFFVKFFVNHGLLNIFNRPTWRVIKGGSRQYIEPLTASFQKNIKLNEAVVKVTRAAQVEVKTHKGTYTFDKVILACHSDQAVKLLADPTELESRVLGAIEYRKNRVTLHTDTGWLPPNRRAWSSWNYRLSDDNSQPPIVTYNMNILQGLDSDTVFCVTLNAADKIDGEKVLGQFEYAHPVLTQQAVEAQGQWAAINTGDTLYCGAYWFNGFHEDGVKSALRAVDLLNASA